MMLIQVSCVAKLAFVARGDRFHITNKSQYCALPDLKQLNYFWVWQIVCFYFLVSYYSYRKSKERGLVEHTTGNKSNNGPLQNQYSCALVVVQGESCGATKPCTSSQKTLPNCLFVIMFIQS